MKNVFLLIGCCLLTLKGFTQQQTSASDSIQLSPELYFKLLAEKFSQTRKLDVSYGTLGSTKFKTYLKERYVDENQIDHTDEVRVNLNYKIAQKQRWKLTYSGYYNYQGYHYNKPNNFNLDSDLYYFSSTFSFTYFSTLFKKPIVYNASLITDASGEMLGRVKGLIAVSYILKADKKSRMGLGIIASIDPTNTFPVIPVFSYTKPVLNDRWRIDLVLPIKAMLQRQLGHTGRISIGSEIDITDTYIKTNRIISTANKFEYRQTHVKSGITYEYLLKNKIVLYAKAGVLNAIRSRISKKGDSFSNDNYILEFKPSSTPYFNIGASFNPF